MSNYVRSTYNLPPVRRPAGRYVSERHRPPKLPSSVTNSSKYNKPGAVAGQGDHAPRARWPGLPIFLSRGTFTEVSSRVWFCHVLDKKPVGGAP